MTTEDLKNSEITPEVMQAFFEHHAVLRKLKKTAIDNIVGHASLTYELVYPESYHITEEQGYLWKMVSFESDNEKTREQFEKIRAELKTYMAEYYK